MARIDNAYAYYISTYAQKTVSRYDSHKKSELRKVYNKIVKINKDSPLYKIPNLTDAKKYAIDIKENARSIQNVVASLSDQYGSFEDSFKKRVAMSSDDEKVSVTYIGDGSEESKTNNFDIEVQRLATPQINQGRFLKDNTLSMRPGASSSRPPMAPATSATSLASPSSRDPSSPSSTRRMTRNMPTTR